MVTHHVLLSIEDSRIYPRLLDIHPGILASWHTDFASQFSYPLAPLFKGISAVLRTLPQGPLLVRLLTEFLANISACFLFVDRVHVETLISSSANPQATYKSVVTAQRLPAPRLITIRLGVRVIIETLPSPYTLVTIRNVPLTRVACI